MRSASSRWLLLGGLGWLALSSAGRGSDPITPEQFQKLHALIRPAKHEDKWRQIPWMTSLWQARQRAAEKGKPILLWEMDGHPLGCT